MLKIRLQRVGKKKQVYFRFVLTEHTRKPKGKYLEFLGSWNPHQNIITLDDERIKYWLSKGAKPTDTVFNLLVEKNVLKGPKKTVWKPKKKKKEEKPKEEIKTAETKTLEEKTEEVESKEESKEKKPAEEKIQEKAKPKEAEAIPQASEEKPKEQEK